MVDLACRWLGLELRSPLIVGASPLSDSHAKVQTLVEAGAGAVVMRSLFEEQLIADQMGAHHFFDTHVDTDAEARSFLADSDVFSVSASPILKRLRRLADELPVPVVGSLNGVTPGGWTEYARQLADAGAAAIELNLYDLASDTAETGEQIEQRQLDVVADVVEAIRVPVSVKISPFYSSVPNFVACLESAGAKGVVMFNRYYQPDLDLETLDIDRHLVLSTSAELPMRLRALAVLFGKTNLSLACTGGVHSGTDVAKALLCGANVVQTVSAVLHDGPSALTRIHRELTEWLDAHGYEDLDAVRGATAIDNVANPHEMERLNYAQMLQSWQSRS
ncbi:MAG: dihydroorotate dehydrogenase-like protein [Acidimicrobiia bacterium]